MFIGSFLLFVVLLHFIFKSSLKLGVYATTITSVVFFAFVYSMTQDGALSAGAAAAFATYTL